VCLGKAYLPALEGFTQYLPAGAQVEVLRGGQGPRLTNLRRWLRGVGHAGEETQPARDGRRHADEGSSKEASGQRRIIRCPRRGRTATAPSHPHEVGGKLADRRAEHPG